MNPLYEPRRKLRRNRRIVCWEAIPVKKILFLLVVGAIGASSPATIAQELLVPNLSQSFDDPLPELELADPEAQGSGTRETLEAPSADDGGYSQKPLPSGDLQSSLQLFERGEVERVFDCEPALLESTGTWLRRGFWSAELDVTFLDRIWRKDSLHLMGQSNSGNTLDSTLTVDGGASGAEASPRLKISRFFFRDHMNRDHTAEMIVYGGGQWNQNARLDASTGSTLITLVDNGFPSFGGATTAQFNYDNRFNSFELNYHVKARMLRDRMVLEPSGHWVRRAQPSNTRSLLAGLRFISFDENFSWDAFGIPDSTTDPDNLTEAGNYRVTSDNNLIGPQGGFSWNHERARWSLGILSKGGIFWNHTDVGSSFGVTGGGAAGGSSTQVDNLSFITEAALTGKWHLRPNFSLRAGLEILYVSSVAHAVEQVNFVPFSTAQNIASGDSTYMGGSIGFEGYW